eukprot:TRINITY_DN13694_c0_g1_i3.p1 TRINITY_DN13694_c0_g1~~TRINITY_DN13694_c0_g1_i3.p1  ORF type:complete len:174 (+),score=24.85 TRINITY_DN13694_c0_g1_i3:548-1069(+)
MLLLKFKMQHHRTTSISSLPGSNLTFHSLNSSREEQYSRSLHSSNNLEPSWTKRTEDSYNAYRREVLRNKRTLKGKASLCHGGNLASIFRIVRDQLKSSSNTAGKIISLQQLKEVCLRVTVVFGCEEGLLREERVFGQRGAERTGGSVRGGGEGGAHREDHRGVRRKQTKVLR